MPAFGHGWRWQALLSYLVAVGAGAMVQVHSVLATCSVVLARAGEAGVALGHNVDVHWAWAAKPQCVSTGSQESSASHLPSPLLWPVPQPAASPSPSPRTEGSWSSPASTSSSARVPLIQPLSSGGKNHSGTSFRSTSAVKPITVISLIRFGC